MNPLKSVIVVVVFILFIALVIVTQLTKEEQVFESPIDRIATCQDLCAGNVQCLEHCDVVEINKALKEDDESNCAHIEDLDNRQDCLENFQVKEAYDDLDVDECNELLDPVRKSNCVGNVILLQALKDKNVSLCDQIVNPATKQLCKDMVK